MRGGERVLEAIARTLAPEHEIAALYTMFDDGRPLSPHLDPIPKRIAWLGRMPGANRARRWLLPLYPAAVASLSRRLAADHARAPIDLLISSSSAAIKGLRPPHGVPHLCYCHTPARYLWSQGDLYRGGLRGAGLRALGAKVRRWDKRTAGHVTSFLANSTHTQKEIQRCYERESDVLFPPARTGFFTPSDIPWTGQPPSWLRETGVAIGGPFWLAVGALEPYKCFDDAIAAARLAQVPLVIVGAGSEERRLRRTAVGSVAFLGRVSDERLRDLYRAAKLLIFPQTEDFGIVPVEAQACGCPVLARGAGGALDTVIDGQTGAHFSWYAWDPYWDAGVDEPNDQPLWDAIGRVPERTQATTAACRANAERFGESAFAAGIRDAVARIATHARRNP
jgi:glycosyltransferase involved in cell wall biosynthesis